MDVDVLILGDFRFPGGTSSAVVSEVDALAKAGYAVGLMALSSGPLPDRRALHAGVAALEAHSGVHFVRQGEVVRAKLTCLHHPVVFETLPAAALSIDCDRFVLIVHHPPVDAFGVAQYDVPRIMAITSELFGAVTWAPVGPKVREAFASLPVRPALTSSDWVNVLDPDSFAPTGPRIPNARPVVGRHSRPQAIKWPDDRDSFVQAYPDDPGVDVRLMGYGAEQDAVVETRPLNWQVLPFGALPVADFLGALDYFSYFHGDEWIEAFGRSILEAMAAGLVCFLPEDFAPLFEEGAVYCAPDGVLPRVKAFEDDPSAYRAQSEAARAVVRRKFGPNVAVDRVAASIGGPQPKSPARVRRSKTVMYLTSNGVGMGHITRCMATARRMGPDTKPVIVTMSKAFGVAEDQGIAVEYIPYFQSVGLSYVQWSEKLKNELTQMFRFHRPDVFVFDGNVPYDALIAVMKSFPQMWKVWQRRPLWRPEVGKDPLALTRHFDVVLEPGEFADSVDRGLTKRRQGEALQVPSVRFLDPDEMLDRRAARKVLGLDPEIPAVLLQLGSGNNFDTRSVIDLVCDLTDPRVAHAPIQPVFARWRISKNPPQLPDHVKALDLFPISKFLNAFDAAIAFAGYNTFHENISAGIPTLFTSNDHPEQDEQWLRADYAEMRGVGLSARTSDLYHFRRQFSAILSPEVQARLRAGCARLDLTNGAHEAAAFLEGLAVTRKRSPITFHNPAVAAH